jgi:hypothetical protein
VPLAGGAIWLGALVPMPNQVNKKFYYLIEINNFFILIYFMSLKPNPKEINIILNILKGAQFEFLPQAPFYIDTPLFPPYRATPNDKSLIPHRFVGVARNFIGKNETPETLKSGTLRTKFELVIEDIK